MENIIKKMRSFYPVSDEAIELFASHLRREVFPAKAMLVKAGRMDRHVYFLERGITRSFIYFDGREVTTWFCMEGDGTCGALSLFRHEPCFENVETLEETEAYIISVDELDALYRRHIDLANWMRVMQQEHFLWLYDTHIARLNLSAKARYEKLVKEYPGIFSRAQLGYIASFLGLTQQSLSRIRAGRG